MHTKCLLRFEAYVNCDCKSALSLNQTTLDVNTDTAEIAITHGGFQSPKQVYLDRDIINIVQNAEKKYVSVR